MSLILEALRKSEAERRRAQVPDLLAEPQPAAVAVARPASRWPWIAGLGALAFVAVWFATRTPSEAPIASTPVPIEGDATRDVAPPVVATPVPTRATRPASIPRRPLVIAPPAPQVSQPAPAAPPPRAEPDTVAPPPAPIASAPVAPLPAPAARGTTERITDLGSEERKQLPPLKLSMHMWNDASAARFVIIDGARLGVGDHLGPVVVADILPDGVLLDWNGRALKLPLR